MSSDDYSFIVNRVYYLLNNFILRRISLRKLIITNWFHRLRLPAIRQHTLTGKFLAYGPCAGQPLLVIH